MSKNFIQDIIKIKSVKKIPTSPSELQHAPVSDKFYVSQNTNGQKSNKYKLWFVALISVVFLFFALSFLFAKAKVSIIPKTQNITLNQSFSAVKDSNDDVLSFDLIRIPGEENKTVPALETKDVMTKATGEVIIFNNFSSLSQTLSKDTQLEGSNGKIYKTVAKVVVPGMSKKGTAGQVKVSIYANTPGEEYNSAPLDFVILGFKGTPKYTKFKVRSEGDMVGGTKGKYYKTIEEDKVSLSAKLLQNATNQIPPGFILFKDAVFLDIDPISNDFASMIDNKDGTVNVVIKGMLYGFLFDEKKLTKMIAKNAIEKSGEKYDDSGVHIPDIKNLAFLLDNKDNISFGDAKDISFVLSGPLQIVWDVDSVKLVTDLLGKNKKDFTQILSLYSNITSANVTFRPFWKMSFPEKTKSIEIIVN